MVRTSSLVDRYTDCPLPSGTVDWDCFRPVIVLNWAVVLIEGEERRVLTKGEEEENLEIGATLSPCLLVTSHPRGEKKWFLLSTSFPRKQKRGNVT